METTPHPNPTEPEDAPEIEFPLKPPSIPEQEIAKMREILRKAGGRNRARE